MRLDVYLVNKGYFNSRTKSLQAIERGEVYINNIKVVKPSQSINENEDVNVEIKNEISFVSLGGYKLYKALNDFRYNVSNLVVADIGSSTGGFTDCVIKKGARKVFAVDLNDTLLDTSLKNNSKVVEIIKNVKDLKINDFTDEIDLVVADLSFISSSVYMPILSSIIKPKKHIILLIKPQFELGQKSKLKNGIVKDQNRIKEIVLNVYNYAKENSLFAQDITIVPFIENKNKEYLILLEKDAELNISMEELIKKL